MSTEFIAESLLRRAKPRSPVLQDWVGKILNTPTFCGPPVVADYKMRSIPDDEKVADDQIYALAKALCDLRDSAGFDKPLSVEIMKYYDFVIQCKVKKAGQKAWRGGRFARFKR